MFDLDGTLTRPDAIDFDAIRRRIGMPVGGSILHWIEDNARTPAEVRAMVDVVHDEEQKALARMELGEGFEALVDVLDGQQAGIRVGICTRNSAAALGAFNALVAREGYPPGEELFPVQLARDAHSDVLGRAVANKPSPEPAHEIQRRWRVVDRFPIHEGPEHATPAHAELLFVGDSEDDVLCARRAGFRAGWITHRREAAPPLAHLAFDTLSCVAAELAAELP